MPLDPSIISGIKPLQVDMAQFSPINSLMSVMKIKQLGQEGELNELRKQEYERARTEEEGVRNYFKTADLSSPEGQAGLMQFGKTGLAYGKALTERDTAALTQKETRFKIEKAKNDFTAQAFRDTSQNPSDANITAYKEDYLANPLFNEAEKTRMAAGVDRLLALPVDQRTAFMASQGATSRDLKSTVTPQGTGATNRLLSTPAFGGQATVVPGSEVQIAMSPAQVESNRIAQAQLKVSQDRLAAELATGTLSPASQELAAQLYLQTGTLPPMGIGKGAAGLKASIMNRASEIASGTGATSEEAATGMVQAKQNVATQTKTLKDFSTGIQGQMVTSFNTAIDHLSTVDKLADALNNGDVRAINSIGNVISKQTGSPAPTNFDAARQIVGAEIQKAIIRAGGTGKEREEAANAFNSANSPSQLKGVIETYKQLLGGQLNSLEMQYTANSGRKDFSSKLSPAAKETVKKLRGEGGASATGVDTSNPLLR
jgi:hypothetical protein